MKVIAKQPNNAFTTAELCKRAYRDGNRPKKKHRVAMLRAMRSVAHAENPICMTSEPRIGAVIYNARSKTSRRMAREKLASQHLLRRSKWIKEEGYYWLYKGNKHWAAPTYEYAKLSDEDIERMIRERISSESGE